MAAEPFELDASLFVEGMSVFARNCQICHGERGDGNGEWAKGFQPKPRSFREGMFKFRTTPYGMLPTDEDLQRTIRGGLSGTAMGMFTGLGDNEVQALIVYLKSFSRRWRKPENHAAPMNFPSTPAWMGEAKTREAHVLPGKVLFNNACAVCHGGKADGNGPSSSALTDIWKLPSKPSDLRQEHLRCGNQPADIYRLLVTGMNGTPMISYQDTLSPDQCWDIIAFVLSVREPSVPVLGGAPTSVR